MFVLYNQTSDQHRFPERMQNPGRRQPYFAVWRTGNLNELLWQGIATPGLLKEAQLQARSTNTSAKTNTTGAQNNVVSGATEELHYQY